jgi:hypothetical protein
MTLLLRRGAVAFGRSPAGRAGGAGSGCRTRAEPRQRPLPRALTAFGQHEADDAAEWSQKREVLAALEPTRPWHRGQERAQGLAAVRAVPADEQVGAAQRLAAARAGGKLLPNPRGRCPVAPGLIMTGHPIGVAASGYHELGGARRTSLLPSRQSATATTSPRSRANGCLPRRRYAGTVVSGP